MKTLSLYSLVPRMMAREQDAFVDFGETIAGSVRGWLTDWGIPEADLDDETGRYVLALTLLAVRRQQEFTAANLPEWLRIQARNLAVKHFRVEQEREAKKKETEGAVVASSSAALAVSAHEAVHEVDGTPRGYSRIGAVFGFPSWWVGVYHRALLGLLGSAGQHPASPPD